MKKKIDPIRKFAALLLAVLWCGQLTWPVLAVHETDTIYIATAERLMKLSKQCSLDTWSQGKTVILTADISLEGIGYDPIPTFGGTFDGAGHTIIGLSLTGKISPTGLFSSLQSTAVVKNLNVSGIVEPDGTGEQVGGIAGENNGRIENCSFNGIVSGENRVGGIAGLNDLDGKIENCTVSGSITGSSMTGGIAGKNLGTISGSKNYAYVNPSNVDPEIDLSELDIGLNKDLLTLRSFEALNIATDTGGIAGYSSGMMLNCQNTGRIGCQHVGYNVGGIVGRSCGHLFNCSNSGQVFGRKDVGGIAGQAEPYIVLNLSEDLLSDIRTQLNQLRTLVNGAVDDAEGANSDLSGQISTIGTSLDNAMNHVKTLTDLLSDYGDSTITELNRGSDLVKDTIDALNDMSDAADALVDDIFDALNSLQDAMEELEDASAHGTEALRELQAAIDAVEDAKEQMKSGLQKIKDGLKKLTTVIQLENQEDTEAAFAEVKGGVEDLASSSEELRSAMTHLAEALKASGAESEKAVAAAHELADVQAQMTDATRMIWKGISLLPKSVSPNLEQLESGLKDICDGLEQIVKVPTQLKLATEHLRDVLNDTESATEHLTVAVHHLADAMDEFGDVSDDMADIFDKVEDLLHHLSSADAIQIAHPSEGIDDSADALFSTMEQISSQLETIHSMANGTVDLLAEDLRAIGNQFQTAMNTMLDAVAEIENTGEDILSDVSDENIDAVTVGKLLSCFNEGAVNGDINAGGIVGAMAVEFELDPEDDLLTSDAAIYRREYEMKAILQKCVNTGAVTSRRSYAGAVCGRMELGLVVSCEGYGTVESEQTDYVGGITGYAAGTVRDCFTKCRLSGRNYVGGITGAADSSAKILRCVSFVQIERYEQYAGAVSGGRDGGFYGNCFVSDTLAGLDRISIMGAAEPIEYENLLQMEHLPEAFRSLTLRFWADDQMIQEQTISYGDSFGPEVFPDIPVQEGSFGAWNVTELKNLHFDTDVTAVYTPYRTALASQQLREDGRSVFLVEGYFEDSSCFSAEGMELSASDMAALSGQSFLFHRTVLEAWHLNNIDDGQAIHTVRYLAPSGKFIHLNLYEKRDGVWVKLDTEESGSYRLAKIFGTSAELAVVVSTSIWWVWLLMGLAAGGLICGAFRHRRNQKCKTEDEAQKSLCDRK